MALAPPCLRHRAVFFPAAGQFRATSASGCVSHGRNLISASYGGGGSRNKKQDEARRAVESALGHKKAQFEKWGVEIERRTPRVRFGGPAASGGGWSGGGGWFRWFSSGGFWDAAKQTLFTIISIIAAFFLIANFNVLVAAIVNSLLALLRQIRRALSFIAHCVFQGIPSSASGRASASLDSGSQVAVHVKDRIGMSAKERVVRKWGMD